MLERPYVLISAAMSIDGYIDDCSPTRLLISSPSDFNAVDHLRAEQDAILVGANTLRTDDPRLIVHAEHLKAERRKNGRCADPIKVTVTSEGNLSASLKFFQADDAQKVVYCSRNALGLLRKELEGLATVVEYSQHETLPAFLLGDLHQRGVRRLLVEGGQQIHSLFLQSGLVDEVRLAIGPFFVGEQSAPRFVGPGRYPWSKDKRLKLVAVEQLEDTVVIKYRA
jgi:5-amino-6-(5-phosphoribosylamino)uracil reductase